MHRRRLLELVASGVVGAVSGCTDAVDGLQETPSEPTMPDHDGWPMAGYDAANTGHHRTASLPETKPTEQWRYRRTFDDDHGPSETYLSAPVVHSDGLVFVAEGGEPGYKQGQHKLRALDAATGELVWGYLIAQERFTPTTPAVGDDTVFVSAESQNGEAIEALAVDDGERRWRREFDEEITGPFVVVGDTVVVTVYGTLVALDTETGERRWRAEVRPLAVQPAVEDGTVHVGCGDDTVRALDLATGDQRWEYAIDGGIRTVPTIRDSVVYTGSGDRLVALEDGEVVWTFEPEKEVTTHSVAVDDEQVYVGGWQLYALDAANGTRQWTQEWSMDIYVTRPPVVADGTVVIPPLGWLAVDATDGTHRWEVDGPRKMVGRAAITDGWVYATGNSTLHAFSHQPAD